MRDRALTTFLALKTERVSAPSLVEFLCGGAHLHARQALLADIDVGGGKATYTR